MNCILAVASIRVPVKVTSSRTARSVRKAQKQIVEELVANYEGSSKVSDVCRKKPLS